MDDMQEILEEFFIEAEESLDEIEQDLIKLEAMSEGSEYDPEVIDRLFRGVHTLKGGAGFLGLEKMASLAHAGENLMDEIRSEKVKVNKDVMDALLKTNDLLTSLMNDSREGGDGANIDTSSLISTLERLSGGEVGVTEQSEAPQEQVEQPTEETPAEETQEVTSEVAINKDLLDEVMNDEKLGGDVSDEAKEKLDAAPAQETPAQNETQETAGEVAINKDLLDEVMNDEKLGGDVSDEAKEKLDAAPAQETPAQNETQETAGEVAINKDLLDEVMNDDKLGGSAATETETVETAPQETTPNEIVRGKAVPVERRGNDRRDGKDERRSTAGRRKVERKETNIRVETSRLDSVMNLVGELVLARNALMQQLNKSAVKNALHQINVDEKIDESTDILSRVTQELQMAVLGIRMQPIKKVFDKIPRQVRELKNSLGREVELIIEGEDTEIDKTLVEELADPMVHLIRNAMDHGIETPEVRMAKDKDPQATLNIRAFYEGNSIVIEIEEDGAGIDPAKIKAMAIKKGIISESEASNMSDKDSYRLILAPGFSTAETISDVSGRGVGMDVVNSKISAVKGRIDISSELGKGTKVSIYLPLTLAIMDALVVGVQKEGFAIPIADISEVIKFDKEVIHKVNDSDVIELRGEVLPLYYLAKLTDMWVNIPSEVEIPDGAFVVVVREGSSSVGIVIDEIIGQEEAVVKPVTEMFQFDKAISGATIMGDGMVHMILDIPVLMKEHSNNI